MLIERVADARQVLDDLYEFVSRGEDFDLDEVKDLYTDGSQIFGDVIYELRWVQRENKAPVHREGGAR